MDGLKIVKKYLVIFPFCSDFGLGLVNDYYVHCLDIETSGKKEGKKREANNKKSIILNT